MDKVIPLGDYTLVGANAGSGKSWMLEQFATDVICGDEFMGMPTIEGDILIIYEDNDNPAKVKDRIHRLLHGRIPKHKLFLRVKEGFTICKGDAQSIKSLINGPEHANVVLVILDSLVSIAGGDTDLDGTSSSSKLIAGIRTLTDPKRATILVHHISKNNPITIPILKAHDHPDQLIMNGTRIVSASSDLLVLAGESVANAKGEKVLSEIYVKTCGRRDVLRADFRIGIRDINKDITAMFLLEIDPAESELDQWDEVVLSHFPYSDRITMKDLFELSHQVMAAATLYRTRDRLIDLGYIKLLLKRGQAGLHYFALTEKGQSWYMLHHDFEAEGIITKGAHVPLDDIISKNKKSDDKNSPPNNVEEG